MRRGFTIIEILVVLVLLGVLSGLIVARLSTGQSRAMTLEAQRIGALFDAASRRASNRAQPVLVRYTAGSSTGQRSSGTAAAGQGTFTVMSRPTTIGRYTLEQGDWEPDNLIAPVTLDTLRIQSVLVNDVSASFSSGLSVMLNDPATFGQRTTIRLMPAGTQGNAAQRVYEIRLSSNAQRVRMIDNPAALSESQLTPDGLLRLQTLDLDAAGYGDMTW